MVEIIYSKKLNRESLKEILNKIKEIVEQGKGSLALDGYSMSIDLPDELELKLRFEINELNKNLIIDLKWAGKEVKTHIIGEQLVETAAEKEKPQIESSLSTESLAESSLSESNVEVLSSENKLETEAPETKIAEVTEKNELKELEDALSSIVTSVEETEQEELPSESDVKEKETDVELTEELKPHGNIFDISVTEKLKEESEIMENETTEESETGIPLYESEIEGETEKEESPTKQELGKTEEETGEATHLDDISSTDDLEKILKALKESKFSGEE
ncbi:MAG: hypothetical protein ACTSYQ_03145 [Candidatus Odinarchaeia archaeon]